MATGDSALDPHLSDYIRRLLNPPAPRERMWPVLGAALLAAVCALSFATAMILAPPVISSHVARSAP